MTLLFQMNPFDLAGPQFLALYTVVAFVACLVAYILRKSAAGFDPNSYLATAKLDAYEAAYLSGGSKLSIDTAVATLVRGEALRFSSANNTLSAAAGARFSHPFEQAVYRIVETGQARTVRGLRTNAVEAAERVASRLKSLGLVINDEQSVRARYLPVILMLMVLLFGVIKIFIGISRDRPVGFLFVMCAITFFIGLLFYKSPPVRTKYGDRILYQLQRDNAALESTAKSKPDQLGSLDVALAMALFGVSSLAFTDKTWSALTRQIVPPSSGSSGSSSCGSSSSCGGSGCSGGCGGGGCGGCGS